MSITARGLIVKKRKPSPVGRGLGEGLPANAFSCFLSPHALTPWPLSQSGEGKIATRKAARDSSASGFPVNCWD